MNHGPGMEAALSLTGLTLRTEMILSRRASKYRRALRCLQALASGVQTPSSFQEFPAWQNHQSESTPLEMIKGKPQQFIILSHAYLACLLSRHILGTKQNLLDK